MRQGRADSGTRRGLAALLYILGDQHDAWHGDAKRLGALGCGNVGAINVCTNQL